MADPTSSILWTPKYFGIGIGPVVNGPFANWSASDGSKLIRNIGSAGFLFKQEFFDQILSRTRHRDVVEPTRFPQYSLEFYCTELLLWVEGTRSYEDARLADPVVFTIHAYIDYVWGLFMDQLRTHNTNPVIDYYKGDNLNEDMFEMGILYDPRTVYEAAPICPLCSNSQDLVCATDTCLSRNASDVMVGENTLAYSDLSSIHSLINQAHSFINQKRELRHFRYKRNSDRMKAITAFYRRMLHTFISSSRRRGLRHRGLSGPQRAHAAIAVTGPLPIGQRFESPITDIRTRGDRLPTTPLRRRGQWNTGIGLRGPERAKAFVNKFGPLPIGNKFISPFTDPRTRGDPLPTIPHRGRKTRGM